VPFATTSTRRLEFDALTNPALVALQDPASEA
jgi:hypothetical protein